MKKQVEFTPHCLNKFLIACLLIFSACSQNNDKNQYAPLEKTINWYAGVGQFNGSLDFGNLTSEQNKILTVTIKNVGDTSLPGPASISGSDFYLAYQNCSMLLPGKTCSVKVSFNSQGKINQNYSANLMLGSESALVTAAVELPEPVTELKATVGDSLVSSLEFGTIKFDQSVLKTVKITNGGKDKGPWVVGQSGNGFVISYDNCSNKEILPNKSCTLKISLSGAGKSGEITDTLIFGNLELPMTAVVKNLPTVSQEESDIKVILNNLSVNPGAVDLGTLNLRQTKILNLYLKNEGTDKGIIEEPEIPEDLKLAFNNCEPGKILNPKSSCLIKLVASPQSKGVRSSPLVLQGNDYHLQTVVREPNDKIFCPMDNAEISYITWNGSTYSECEIEECLPEHHLLDNSCDPDVISCPVDNGTGQQTWTGSEYSSCVLESCDLNYHEVSGACVPNDQSCFIENGTGNQTWNGNSWDTCQVNTCNTGYYANEANTACEAGLVVTGNYRSWADGTFAKSCNEYKNPPAGYKYLGATGSAVYRIRPVSTNYDVYCDQVIDNGGWMLVARSVSGAGNQNFGWKYSTGSVFTDTAPYSINYNSLGMNFSQVLFGNYSSGKNWGSYVYRHSVNWGTLKAYTGSALSLGSTPTPISGGNTTFNMALHMGFVNKTNFYWFRDGATDATYGLYYNGWSLYYPSVGGGNAQWGGYIDGSQGMIMVR